MGIKNHGNQDATWEYFEAATAKDFNKRNNFVIPRGIYDGGQMYKITNANVIIAKMTVEIGDANEQVTIKTNEEIEVTTDTLDSGELSVSYPYIILRWNFLESTDNFMEVHALSDLSQKQANDLVIGKILWSGANITGFDYKDRSEPKILDRYLKVEPVLTAPTPSVWVRGGIIHTTKKHIVVAPKIIEIPLPEAPNSRIDLIYIDENGVIKRGAGAPVVNPTGAPTYAGKMVIAEVLVHSGDTVIPATQIKDTRAFILPAPEPKAANLVEKVIAITTPTYTGTTFQTIPEHTLQITTKAGIIHITGTIQIKYTNEARWNSFRIVMDGEPITDKIDIETGENANLALWPVSMYKAVAAGTHTIEFQWACVQTNLTLQGRSNYIQVLELPL